MKVALVHDYLMVRGGAERVVEAFHELFPDAPVYTSVFSPETTWPAFKQMDVRTSFLQRFKWATEPRWYKLLLPLFPYAFESFDLSAYDVVLSSTSAFAKGVITGPQTIHINYCHTPARFAWRFHDYVEREPLGAFKQLALEALVHPLRTWDVAAAQRVDHFIANSRTTADRVQKFYRRAATVIEPPIDAERYQLAPAAEISDEYLIVSRLAPYKRIDLAIQAFNQLGLPLRIVGTGPDRERLQAMAGPTIRFGGYQTDAEVAALMARARAFILPGEEDFGMTPLEANTAGRPVIAFAGGGALETVVPGLSGVHFTQPTAASLAQVVQAFDPTRLSPLAIRAHALRFSRERFLRRIRDYVEARYADRWQMPSQSAPELSEILGQMLRWPGSLAG